VISISTVFQPDHDLAALVISISTVFQPDHDLATLVISISTVFQPDHDLATLVISISTVFQPDHDLATPVISISTVFQSDHDLATLVISTVSPIHQVVCDSILCYDWYTLLGVGNKLFCGHVPDSFPRYRIGSGCARLDQDMVNHSQKQSGSLPCGQPSLVTRPFVWEEGSVPWFPMMSKRDS